MGPATPRLPEGRSCPRDGSLLLSRTTAGVRHLFCTTCHGLWLPAEQLRAVAERVAAGAASPRPRRATAVLATATDAARCVCAAAPLMAVREAHGVTVDLCAACGAVWLDGGELQRAARHLAAAAPPAVVATGAAQQHASSTSILDGLELLEPLGGLVELLVDVLCALGDLG